VEAYIAERQQFGRLLQSATIRIFLSKGIS